MKNITFSKEVQEAQQKGTPIVALESTILSHGMPYPQNLSMAKNVEDIIRKEGVIPATVGIINGKIKIGLEKDELEYFATQKDIIKCSRRDFPYILSKKLNGATTVSGTMFACSLAGIKVFVTGGIGGVHRGHDKALDISADLTELANTDVAVVCAGVKSILDIKNTLEVLETFGVPVITYRSKEFPAFYCRESGEKSEYTLETPQEIAELIKVKWEMKLKGGVVIGNPIPKDFEMPKDEINKVIEVALKEAQTLNIQGKEITPFLLKKIKDETKGISLKSNIALVESNALLGAQIAKSLNS